MKKIFFLLLISTKIYTSNIYAEKIISTGAVLYDMNSRASLVSLAGNISVNTGNINKGFFSIMIWIKCNKKDIVDDNYIRRGRKLYDTSSNYVGYSRENIYIQRRTIDREDTIFIELLGMVDEFSIEVKSIVEYDLNTIFKLRKKELVYDDFIFHLNNFAYIDGKGEGNFTSKIYMDGGVDNFNDKYRLILVFIKQDLAAILYTREINVPYYESKALSMPYKIYYMKKLVDKEKLELAKLYLPQSKP